MIMNNFQDEQDEQNEQAYQKLIAKVATINKDAADYMQGPMRKIHNFVPSGDLWDVVIWWKTLQGHRFWDDIACKLEE
jgi:hypothetical protein